MMKVYTERCRNCLFSKDAIVSPERRKDILNECKRQQSYFICHKATMNGDDVCCRAYYDECGHDSQKIRLAERLNVITFIDQPDSEKLPTYREMRT